MGSVSTKLAWHEPAGVEGARTHWHGPLGIPICGAGWFTGRKTDAPANPCKRCAEYLARARANA